MTSRRLLVVDSDSSSQQLLRSILEREDRSIHEAHNRAEAEDCLRALQFDLVLARQGSNGTDGVRIARRVHTLQPDARVILTGDSSPKHVIGAIRAHAFAYCHHPPSPGSLKELVSQALEASSWQNDILVTSAVPHWVALEVRCKMDAADRTTNFVREMHADLPLHLREDVASAFRELLFNAVEHGGHYDPRKRVRVWIVRTPKSLIFQIQDPGKGFSLDSVPHAAISNPDDSPIRHVEVRVETGQRPGGFGILMTRNLVDELVYNERGNSVLFVKYL